MARVQKWLILSNALKWSYRSFTWSLEDSQILDEITMAPDFNSPISQYDAPQAVDKKGDVFPVHHITIRYEQ